MLNWSSGERRIKAALVMFFKLFEQFQFLYNFEFIQMICLDVAVIEEAMIDSSCFTSVPRSVSFIGPTG